MKLVTSLAVVIGGLGALATWLFLAPLAGLHLQIWAAFIAWASYFATGGTPADLPKSLLANLWGVAWATAALIGVGIFGHLGAPVIALIVGVTVCLMILGGHLPLLGGGSRPGLRLRADRRLRSSDLGSRNRHPSRYGPFNHNRRFDDRRRGFRLRFWKTGRHADQIAPQVLRGALTAPAAKPPPALFRVSRYRPYAAAGTCSRASSMISSMCRH